MRTVGVVPSSPLNNGVHCTRRLSTFTKLYTAFWKKRLEDIAQEKFAVVLPVPGNVGKTINSWDEKPPMSYEGTPEYNFAVEFFHYYYGDIMKDCIATSEEIAAFIDWTKSPGWPHTYLGFRSKEELVQAMAYTSFYKKTSILPLHNISGKVEFLSKEVIDQMKIRIFQIPPFELLYSQLKFGKRISLRLMNKHWSAYGFNPYGGGFHRLAQKLLSKPYRGCYDVSGWDKFLPLLKDIYRVLREKGEIPETELDEFLWMVQYTCEFLLRLPDGRVIQKKYGNASGSGVTTRDNIFGHIIIFAAGLYSAFFKKNGVAPTMQLIHDQFVSLYGDDNVFAVDEEFSLICDPEFLSAHLGKFGLKLKFFYGGLNADLSVLSFLGAHFKHINGTWYPMYDVERLATTMLYEKDKLTLDKHISKVFTLMVMSYPTGHFDTFLGAYTELVQSSVVQNEQEDPVIRSYAFLGVPTRSQIEAFYKGSEADSVCEHFRFFYVYPDLVSSVEQTTSPIHYDHTGYEPNDWAQFIYTPPPWCTPEEITKLGDLYSEYEFLDTLSHKKEGPLKFLSLMLSPNTETENAASVKGVMRGDRKIKKWVRDGAMSDAGMRWYKIAIDPFHDTPMRMSGMPDKQGGFSVVREYRQSFQISTTPLVAPLVGVVWDCIIVAFNQLFTQTFTPSVFRLNQTVVTLNGAVPANTAIFGGIGIWAVLPGTSWDPFHLASAANTQYIGSLSAPAAAQSGMTRIIAGGWKVENTTAVLTVQGTITPFKTPQTSQDATCWTIATSTVALPAVPASITPLTMTSLRYPPVNLATAMLYPGSRSWLAKEGMYMVTHIHSFSPAFPMDYNTPIYLLTDDGNVASNTAQVYLPLLQVGVINATASNLAVDSVEAQKLENIHEGGCWLNGLSSSTTLYLEWRLTIENFPGPTQATDLPIAEDAPSCDEVALELYDATLQEMPVAMMAKENFDGGWWANVVDTVGTVLEYIPHPLAQGAAATAHGGANVLRKIGNTNSPKGAAYAKKPKQPHEVAGGRMKVAKHVPAPPSPAANGAAANRYRKTVAKQQARNSQAFARG